MFSLVQDNPEVTMDCIIHMAQNITPSQRAKVCHLLATMDNTTTSWSHISTHREDMSFESLLYNLNNNAYELFIYIYIYKFLDQIIGQ